MRFLGTEKLPSYPPRLSGKFHQPDYKAEKPRRAKLTWEDVRRIRETNKRLCKDWKTNRRAEYLRKYLHLEHVTMGAIRQVLLNQTFCEVGINPETEEVIRKQQEI